MRVDTNPFILYKAPKLWLETEAYLKSCWRYSVAQLFEPADMNLVLSDRGEIVPNARLSFYRHGTLEYIAVYSDSSCTIPLPNPIYADQDGHIPDVYVADSIVFDVRVHDDCGNMVSTRHKVRSKYASFPFLPCLSDLRIYDGPSSFVYTTDGSGRLALYRLSSDGSENLPTVLVGVKGTWVGGAIITEYDLAAYIQEAVTLATT